MSVYLHESTQDEVCGCGVWGLTTTGEASLGVRVSA